MKTVNFIMKLNVHWHIMPNSYGNYIYLSVTHWLLSSSPKKEGPSTELEKIISDLNRLPQVLEYLVRNLEQQGKELEE